MGNLARIGRRLSEGVGAWLQFEFHCRRGDLFSERYIAHPVGCLLAAELRCRVQAEFNHPVLAAVAGNGRKPQLDFGVFEEKDGTPSERKSPKLIGAVETKWLSRGTVDVGDILWDIIRLELLSAYLAVNSYFVLAGLKKRLTGLFESEEFCYSGTQQTLVPIDSKLHHHTLHLSKVSERVRKLIDARIHKYPGVIFPKTITVHSPHYYPRGGVEINLSFGVYVWSIGVRERCEREWLKAQVQRSGRVAPV